MDDAKDLNLIIQNASSIIAHPTARKTALLTIKVNSSHISILRRFESEELSFYTEIISKNENQRIELKNLKEEDEIILDISPSLLKSNFNFNFYFTYNEFISLNYLIMNDTYFYILEQKITSFQTSENKYLSIHSIILKLQDILNDIADDTEQKTKSKIYTMFDSKKIKISSDFNFEDIKFIIKNDSSFGKTVTDLYDELELKNEKKTRAIFFKKSLEITFQKKDIQLSDILRNLEKLFTEYESHYRAYINSLEPEKIKHQFEEEHNNFLKELNVVLGDVHNKIIFIPIAFIFGASQLTSGGGFKGLIIIIGMLIFSIFVSLFLDTHGKILKILDNKITEKEDYYKEREPTLYKSYKNKIYLLKDLSSSILIRITIIRYSNWALTLASAIFFSFIHS